MANPEHLELLKKGVKAWNEWRTVHTDTYMDLSKVDLREINISGMYFHRVIFDEANLSEKELSGTFTGSSFIKTKLRRSMLLGDFSKVDLSGADLRNANCSGAILRGTDLRGANLRNAFLPHVDLRGVLLTNANLSKANLSGTDMADAELRWANLSSTNLSSALLIGANLKEANFSSTDLSRATLYMVDLSQASLINVNLSKANLMFANLRGSHLMHANLSGARLYEAACNHADLTGADLTNADLRGVDFTGATLRESNLNAADLSLANLSEADLNETNLTGCRVYGISAWNVQLNNTNQIGLVITRHDEATITVDNIEIAQFIYLLLNHKKLRDVFNTMTERGVLILGRFGGGGLEVLQAIAGRLREEKYLPIIFDFERPQDRNYTETVKTLAGLSRFVIADLSGSSVPQELYATVPHFKIPFVPIIEAGKKPFTMAVDLLEYPWVVRPPVTFTTTEELLEQLPSRVIAPAEEKHQARQKLLDELFDKS